MVSSASNLRPPLVLSPLGSMCQLFFQHGRQYSFPGSHSLHHFSLSRNQMTHVLQSRSSFTSPHCESASLVAWWMSLIKGSRNLQQAEWDSITLCTVPADYVATFQLWGETSKLKWPGIRSSVTRRECFHSCFMFHVSSAARLRINSASGQILLKTFLN
jgi:hypothetical protein